MNGLPIADVTTFTPGRDALTNGLLLQLSQMDCSDRRLGVLEGPDSASDPDPDLSSGSGSLADPDLSSVAS